MKPSPAYGPGMTIGVLGAGQLGRMFAMAAVRMGFQVHVFAPDANDAPASAFATQSTQAEWSDEDALRTFARTCDVVTLEFENVPLASVDVVEAFAPVRPGREVLRITQDRSLEKEFLTGCAIPVAPWWPVNSEDDLRAVAAELQGSGLLKTARLGYDGKGQRSVTPDAGELVAAWRDLGEVACVLEQRVALATEVAVVVARSEAGEMRTHPVIETRHVNGILDLAEVPASVSEDLQREVREMACAMAEGLNLHGIACLECFVTTDGRVLANEIAPRPHNSAHLTIEACSTSQFEQQVRAVTGFPLDEPVLLESAVMSNLLGEHTPTGEEAKGAWMRAASVPGVSIHLYGKHEARHGRKMGHLTAIGIGVDEARGRAIEARAALTEPHAAASNE